MNRNRRSGSAAVIANSTDGIRLACAGALADRDHNATLRPPSIKLFDETTEIAARTVGFRGHHAASIIGFATPTEWARTAP